MTSNFESALSGLLNQHCAENGSDTPDFILARFLARVLADFDDAVSERTRWHSTPRAAVITSVVDALAGQSPGHALGREVEKVIRQRNALASVLREVCQWIDGWSPNFTDDGDWPDVAGRIQAALGPLGGDVPPEEAE